VGFVFREQEARSEMCEFDRRKADAASMDHAKNRKTRKDEPGADLNRSRVGLLGPRGPGVGPDPNCLVIRHFIDSKADCLYSRGKMPLAICDP